ncbi:hypothetical protein [Bacillus licheniformis]|uniref:hypothetical protein n=1 Tax=Bacillus licheniformis TaxID=1402 RepID=UPI0008FAF158|nr:hypothetical protein [Bacillus licheniformis]OIS80669.1 hypothetical protein A4A43_09695 [Bacillus licheniformis]OIS81734.1 hypothetical protein A4A40_07560 [Bacillus licheniformis]OIS82252.1 hypothetical protein A4A38_05660 [Bacillus licheniformis]OIS89955.1 hypothetical protein A4A42_00025 [Bacillus licheniformis]TWK91170.1 hypothetical protein CHCC20327_2547 [Bacillus licheniformis]
MDVMEYIFKKAIIEGARSNTEQLVEKFKAGEELTREEVERLLTTTVCALGIIQEEILEPVREEFEKDPFFQSFKDADGPLH